MDFPKGQFPDDYKNVSKVFDENFYKLVGYAERIIQDKAEAEDIVMLSFDKLWQRRQKYDTHEKMRAFLAIATRNACFNYLEKRKTKIKHARYASAAVHIEAADIVKAIEKRQYVEYLFTLTHHLEPQCRKIIEYTLLGLNAEEIAEETKLSINTVNKQKYNGKMKLIELAAKSNHPKIILLILFIQYL